MFDLRRHFPSLVEERTPEVAYDLSRWLLEEARPASAFDSDWLVAAFAAAPGPTLSGKSFRLRSF
jgi:hypothetical protein